MVVLSTDAIPRLRLTVDEYLQTSLPEGNRYELVNGVIEVSPNPAPMHDAPLDPLQEALYSYRASHPGLIQYLTQRACIPIPSSASVREPDLALYRQRLESDSWEAWKRVVPFWVAEVVSPLGEARDYDEKRRDYWAAGVEEYWIIDPQAGRITVLSRGPADWAESVYDRTAIVRSTLLPGFTVPAARLLPILE